MVTTGYLERDVVVGGLKLHYQEWGNPSAPAVVMLHGFGVSGHMFDEFAERMQDRFHLIAFDQRGHGDSDWSEEGDYTRDAFVGDLEGATQELGLERFLLIGHSMGGLNSVAYTLRHPERVRALVLVDVGPEAAKEGVDNIARFTRGPDELDFDKFVEMAHRFNQRRSLENIRERMRHRLKPTENGKWTWKFDRRLRTPESGLKVGSQLSNDEMWRAYRSISVPTLLVRGGESDILKPDVAERAAREMQRARLVVVPGAGHSVPGDNPEGFTEAVSAFIADLDGGAFVEPIALDLPPLEKLVEAQSRRRGPSVAVLVMAGLGAVLALSGLAYTAKQRSDRKRELALARAAAAQRRPRRLGPTGRADLELAQQRAMDLSRELAAAGRRGISRARDVVQEVEIDQAREAALDVLRALGERTRLAEEAVSGAVLRVDREKLKRRGQKAAKRGRSAGRAGLRVAMVIAPRLLGLASRTRQSKRLWRS